METFLEYIEKDNYRVVINTLCFKRVKEADKRNKHDKLRKLSSDYKVPDCKGEGIYDIMGRKVAETTASGFYIINGKKVFVVK